MKAAPQEEYDDQPRCFWCRLKDRFGFGDYDDEEEYVDDPISQKKQPVVRMHRMNMHYVSVWRTLADLENARQAADGLKAGHQQIINIKQASADMRARITDFLNGVTYALDGSVEKVGEDVYLYTPRNCHIEVEDEATSRKSNSTFNDN